MIGGGRGGGGLWGQKASNSATRQRKVRYHDAWCQTYIEVQDFGVQVTPDEIDGGGGGGAEQQQQQQPRLFREASRSTAGVGRRTAKAAARRRSRLLSSEDTTRAVEDAILNYDSDYDSDFSQQHQLEEEAEKGERGGRGGGSSTAAEAALKEASAAISPPAKIKREAGAKGVQQQVLHQETSRSFSAASSRAGGYAQSDASFQVDLAEPGVPLSAGLRGQATAAATTAATALVSHSAVAAGLQQLNKVHPESGASTAQGGIGEAASPGGGGLLGEAISLPNRSLKGGGAGIVPTPPGSGGSSDAGGVGAGSKSGSGGGVGVPLPPPSRAGLEKVDVAIQTEREVLTEEERSGFRAVPSALRKYEVIGDDPDVFRDIDQWVIEVSKKR